MSNLISLLKTKLKLISGKYQKISYSQSGEDLILDRFLKDTKNGVYVDIGANHPAALNNTYFFYKHGWRGINVEPHPQRYQQLCSFRNKDLNLNLAISNKRTTLNYYIFKNDVLSTTSATKAKQYQNMGHVLVKTIRIPTLPLAHILETHLPKNSPIDILSIDTEGLDLEILKSNNWKLFRPKFIVLETLEYQNIRGKAKKLNAIFESYLSKKRYKMIADTYINSIFVDLDHWKIH